MPCLWQIKEVAPRSWSEKFPEIDPLILQLLYNRGLTEQSAIDRFLTLDYSQDQYDPFLFTDMTKAVARIEQALAGKEKIVVHGDYDADGVCASVIMMQTLRQLEAVDPEVYIPHRESEGYGLNKETVNYFQKKGVQLIITVDCGVSNSSEISLAKEKGIETIITDHHAEPLNLPTAAVAIINPQLSQEKYPAKELSGAAVAFKVAQALIQKHKLGEGFEKWLLDLVVISLVTDCINLIGESRLLAFYGLKVLRQTRRPGLQELVRATRRDLQSLVTQNIAWQIGPRLNAAGRMDHANSAYQLLLTTETAEARELAKKIEDNNCQRQKISEEIYKAALKQVQEQESEKFFLIQGESWPLGVVGLVAGKIADKFYRPTLICTTNQGEVAGSGRSIPEFNMIEAIKKCAQFFARYGGHSQACGFTFNSPAKVADFQRLFKKIIEGELKAKDLRKKVSVEAEIELTQINWDLIKEIERFEPFGEGNPQPLFLSRARIVDWQIVGASGQHLRLLVTGQGRQQKLIAFGLGPRARELKIDEQIEFIYELGVNQWNGSQEIQLKMIDFKICQN